MKNQLVIFCCLIAACGAIEGKTNNGTNNIEDESIPTELVLTEVLGPCAGSPASTMLFDNPTDGLVGCGTDVGGEGLFQTTDGGKTWEELRAFDDVRVMELLRVDEQLYVAGSQTDSKSVAWTVDDSFSMTPLYDTSDDNIIRAENIAVDSTGRIILDLKDLSDSDEQASVARASAGDEFMDIDLPPVTKIKFVNDGLYGVDVQAHYSAAFLPSDSLPYQLRGSDVGGSKGTHAADFHVFDETSMILAIAGFPMVHVGAGDLRTRDSWTDVDLPFEYPARVFSMSANEPGHVLIVGEHFDLSNTLDEHYERIEINHAGFVVFSKDRGLTWEDITPKELTSMTEVKIFDNGKAFMTGGNGKAWMVSGL